DRLRPEIEADDARRLGHELKIPNPKIQIPNKSQAPTFKADLGDLKLLSCRRAHLRLRHQRHN
ncbi:MAG TPA: hypothetical protein VEL08_05565, partial [Chthoniobacterales bacterium]|nr:hypothetical protein [Chthoniobacterales bacterium]